MCHFLYAHIYGFGQIILLNHMMSCCTVSEALRFIVGVPRCDSKRLCCCNVHDTYMNDRPTRVYSRSCGHPSALSMYTSYHCFYCYPVWNLKPSWEFHGDHLLLFSLFKIRRIKYLDSLLVQ